LHLDGGSLDSYPQTGTTWYDLSGNSQTATLVNGPSYNSTGPSIGFDGTDDYAQISSNSLFNFGTGDFTLEAWVYPQSFSNYFHIIAMPNQDSFALKAEVNTGNIYFYSPTFDTYGSTSGWTLTLNTWNYVSMTRNSSVAYAYLNAVSKGSKSSFTNSFSNNTVNIHNGFPNEFVPALFGAVRVYNRALSSTEITQNYNAQKSRFGL
jgi:hypothetical protein